MKLNNLKLDLALLTMINYDVIFWYDKNVAVFFNNVWADSSLKISFLIVYIIPVSQSLLLLSPTNNTYKLRD